MSADWIGTYRLQLHAGFTLADAAAGASLSGRSRHEPRVPVALPAGDARQHAWLRRHGSRPASARISAARRRGAASSARRARRACRILLDIVPEPHVGLGAQSVVGRCAGARPVQRVRGVLRHPQASRISRSGCNICSLAHAYGESLEKGESRARVARRAAAGQALRQFLAAGARLVGRAAGGGRSGRPRARRGCFEDLERLRWFTQIERCGPRGVPARRRGGARLVSPMRTATGGSSRPSSAPSGDPDPLDADHRAAILHAARLEARGRADQLPALLRRRLPGRHPHRDSRGVRGVACAHRAR